MNGNILEKCRRMEQTNKFVNNIPDWKVLLNNCTQRVDNYTSVRTGHLLLPFGFSIRKSSQNIAGEVLEPCEISVKLCKFITNKDCKNLNKYH